MPKISNLASRRPGGARLATSGRTERPVTFRLDQSRLGLLSALAIVDETTVAEQIRLASESYIAVRLADPQLTEKTEAAVKRFRRGFTPLIGQQEAAVDDTQDYTRLTNPNKAARDVENEKPVTLRLDNRSVDYYTSLALLDDGTLADQLRAAVDFYVSQRRQDPELEQRIKDACSDQNDLLAKLSFSA